MANLTDLKEKIDDLKDKVNELEDKLQANYVSKDVYEREVKQINKKIDDIETDVEELKKLPDKVKRNCENIEEYNVLKRNISWLVFSSIGLALMAFIIKGGIA